MKYELSHSEAQYILDLINEEIEACERIDPEPSTLRRIADLIELRRTILAQSKGVKRKQIGAK